MLVPVLNLQQHLPVPHKNNEVKVVVIGTFAPESQPGGVTMHCTRLAERLRESGEFSVRTVNVKYRSAIWKSLLRTNPLTWMLAVISARAAGFRIFHFNTSSRNFPFFFLAPLIWILRGKILLSFHSGAIAANLKKLEFPESFAFRLALGFADCVLFMNKRECEAVAAKYPQFASRFHTIHSFIVPSRKQIKIPEHKTDVFTVAAMGAWLYYYSFEDVIAVLEGVAEKYPKQKFELRIAVALFNWDLDYKREIRAKIAEVNRAGKNLKITFQENVEDSLAFLAEVDLFIRSSSVDSFGLCVAEAVFLGKPAIATDVCRRVAGVYLYAPHDLKKLETHVVDIFERSRAGKLEKIELDAREDAFPLLCGRYRMEAGVA
jgi:glycosyltransferase involved in cell wall biosynthesis